MKTNLRAVLLAGLAVFAFSAVAVASASASEFVFSKTGTLKGAQVGNQKFHTAAGNFACTNDKVSGSTSVLKSATQKVTVQYEGCTLFGVPLSATAAEYELNTNGTFKLLKAFTLKETFGGSCTMTFKVQNLSGDTYKNTAGKVEVVSEVASLISFGEGIACTYAEGKGTFVGTSLIELVGGTMEVK